MNIKVGVLFLLLLATSAFAGNPVWTFTPLTATTVILPSNASTTIQYLVTNQSSKPHTLVMNAMPGVTQITTGVGICANPFVLSSKGASCVLSLQVNGAQLTGPINNGPIVCQQGAENQCYRPSEADILHITQAPSNCTYTGDNNIQCEITIDGQTNFGFTNMTYAICRSAQCNYNGVQTDVSCDCDVIDNNQGVDSASVSPLDYNSSKPVSNLVTSTYSRINSSGETPTNCPSGPFANCFGATCVVSGSTATCTCPVSTDPYIAPFTNCSPGVNKIWSATSTSSFPSIDGAMQFMYDVFFDGNSPD